MSAGPARTRWPRPIVLAAAAVLAAVFLLPLGLGTPLLDPDEGLHAAIALEMVERGDWVTPRFLGQPFLDKPVLFFWALALSIAGFGATELAIKLPGLLFAALGALATGWLTARLFDRRAGQIAAVFHATMLLPLALGEVAVHDVALVPFTTAAVVLLWEAAHARATVTTLACGSLAGVALGLSMLAKALTGVALIGLPFAIWALVTRRLSPRVVAAGVASLLIATAVAAPWYLAMEASNPGYLHYYFVERHVGGYTTTSQLHGHRAWWYYLPVLAGGGLPWVAYLFAAGPFGGRWRPAAASSPPDTVADAASPGLSLLWIWLLVDLLFLSMAGSKLITYLLPAFPAVAALAAYAWQRALVEDTTTPTPRPQWTAAHLAAFLPLAGVLAAALALTGTRAMVDVPAWAWAAVGLAAAGWLGVAATALTRPRSTVLAAALASFALTVVVGLVAALPAIAPAFTAREVARHFNRQGTLPGRLWFFDERVGSFVFYLDRSLRAGLTPDRLARARPDQVLSMRQAPADTAIVVPLEALPKLERWIPLQAQPSTLAGHHRIYDAAAFASALRESVAR